METRKLAFKDDENPSKRQRVDDDTKASVRACFDALNDDCVLHIFSNLSFGDLNTFGLVNRRYRTLRNHESLDQSREAVIVCSRSATRATTLASLSTALDTASRTLNTNYTKLKIVGLETVRNASSSDPREFRPGQHVLLNVTSLELVVHQFGNSTAFILEDP